MCRISGIVNKSASLDSIKDSVIQMCNLQKHGGPDDEGIYFSETDHVVLGNRRLALIDLSREGHMPMEYRNRYFITYNGELYNYLILKEELTSLGHQFCNHTDTEVVLAAFAEWNTNGFSKLKGMFAFALWDNHEKELYLVRDPAGIKPLYFASVNETLIFASEVRAFKSVSYLSDKNTQWPVFLMAYGHIPEPISTLSNVKPLPKGSFLKFNVSKNTRCIQSFEHFSFNDKIKDRNEARKLISSTLEDAVKRHLIADAPLGVFLSGGLDSSIIAILASKYQHSSLNTLSVYFEETEFSEKKFQDIIHERIKCSHHPYLLRESEFHQSFEIILDSMDMPSCDGINTWFISKYAASQGLKAVLSGIGGDELFGGYPSFRRIKAARTIQKLPFAFINSGKKSTSKRLNRMAYLNLEGIKGIYLFLRGQFTPYEIARQLGAYEKEIWRILDDQPILSDISHIAATNQASWMEFNLYMQNQLLRDADVMSMIHGVEIRVPFLYEDIIRLAYKITPDVKFEGPLSKQVLIDSFNGILPDAIWKRPKMGFSFPFTKWLSSSEFVKELMANGNKNSKESYHKFLQGTLHWSHIMSLIILEHRKA